MSRNEVVGHAEALTSIPTPLPATLLLSGPEGVGKRHVARLLGRASGARGLDLQTISSLDKGAARQILSHHALHPLVSEVRTTVADLSGASADSVNVLLKLLEEPPEYSRLILHTDTTSPLTLRSRCFAVNFGVLTTEEVLRVLTRLRVENPEEAARFSRGRVSVGLAYSKNADSRKETQDLLKAVAARDIPVAEELLAGVLSKKRSMAEESDQRPQLVAHLLITSLMHSIANSQGHILGGIPARVRSEALSVLQGSARIQVRLRSAIYLLLTGRA